MSDWLVRTGAPSIGIAERGRLVTITSRRMPRISKGDTVVILDDSAAKSFTRIGKVAGLIEMERSSDGKTSTRVELSEFTDLPQGIYLEDFKYSFPFVLNTR